MPGREATRAKARPGRGGGFSNPVSASPALWPWSPSRIPRYASLPLEKALTRPGSSRGSMRWCCANSKLGPTRPEDWSPVQMEPRNLPGPWTAGPSVGFLALPRGQPAPVSGVRPETPSIGLQQLRTLSSGMVVPWGGVVGGSRSPFVAPHAGGAMWNANILICLDLRVPGHAACVLLLRCPGDTRVVSHLGLSHFLHRHATWPSQASAACHPEGQCEASGAAEGSEQGFG